MPLLRTFLALVIASPATAAAAFAVPPATITRTGGLHFVGQPDVTATKTATSAFLTATGEVAGAGTSATATLTADVTVVRGCVNQGGNQPRGLQRSFETTTGSVTFETRSGRRMFTASTNPITTAGLHVRRRT